MKIKNDELIFKCQVINMSLEASEGSIPCIQGLTWCMESNSTHFNHLQIYQQEMDRFAIHTSGHIKHIQVLYWTEKPKVKAQQHKSLHIICCRIATQTTGLVMQLLIPENKTLGIWDIISSRTSQNHLVLCAACPL